MRAAEEEKTVSPQEDHSPATIAGTARFIARSLLVASHEPHLSALIPPGSADACRQLLAAAGDTAFVRAAENRLFRSVFRGTVDFLLPGIALHYLARKRCLEDWLHRAIGPEGGCQQVVVLGAGLDTLAWRLHRARTDVCFIEADRPAALRVKETALAAAGAHPPNLTFLAADLLRASPAQALGRHPAFDPSRQTLFLAEGLLMYLPPARVRSLLAEIAALRASDAPGLLAFTFMEARADECIRFRRSNPLVDRWLWRQGEPFRWSVAPDRLADFLAETGWQIRELVSGDDLRRRYLLPAGLREAPLAVGEWLALAQTVPNS